MVAEKNYEKTLASVRMKTAEKCSLRITVLCNVLSD